MIHTPRKLNFLYNFNLTTLKEHKIWDKIIEFELLLDHRSSGHKGSFFLLLFVCYFVTFIYKAGNVIAIKFRENELADHSYAAQRKKNKNTQVYKEKKKKL